MKTENTKVFEIEYIINDGIATISIRAFDKQEALRIAKKMTGSLIKNMRVLCKCGYGFKAAND